MKKIIYAVALVLSFGLLASCNNVYATKDVENQYEKNMCEVTGTITFNNTTYWQDTDLTIKEDVITKDVVTIKNVPTETIVTYGENSNSNYTTYTFSRLVAEAVAGSEKDVRAKEEIKWSTKNDKVIFEKYNDGVKDDFYSDNESLSLYCAKKYGKTYPLFDEYDNFLGYGIRISKIGLNNWDETNGFTVYEFDGEYYMEGLESSITFSDEDGVIKVSGEYVRTDRTDEKDTVVFDLTFTKK